VRCRWAGDDAQEKKKKKEKKAGKSPAQYFWIEGSGSTADLQPNAAAVDGSTVRVEVESRESTRLERLTLNQARGHVHVSQNTCVHWICVYTLFFSQRRRAQWHVALSFPCIACGHERSTAATVEDDAARAQPAGDMRLRAKPANCSASNTSLRCVSRSVPPCFMLITLRSKRGQ
jgi:hypothetical protein